MTTAMATRESTLPALPAELTIEELVARTVKVGQAMKAVMKDGEHYGTIPGTPKPTLLKPGAEKLLNLFMLDPQYAVVRTKDGEHLDLESTCTLYHIPTGMRVGSGMGSCSTRESKYAYRLAKRRCPKCDAEAINKSKFPPRGAPRGTEPGWYCYAKVGGCGAEFAADDTAITGQTLGRIANPDIADQYNTVLKMANKRSLVAAVLNVTAASDIFTQDLEDTHEEPARPPAPPETPEQEAARLFATPQEEETRKALERIRGAFEIMALAPDEQRLLWDTACPGVAFLSEDADPAALQACIETLIRKHQEATGKRRPAR